MLWRNNLPQRAVPFLALRDAVLCVIYVTRQAKTSLNWKFWQFQFFIDYNKDYPSCSNNIQHYICFSLLGCCKSALKWRSICFDVDRANIGYIHVIVARLIAIDFLITVHLSYFDPLYFKQWMIIFEIWNGTND